jgi:hypothetical protein
MKRSGLRVQTDNDTEVATTPMMETAPQAVRALQQMDMHKEVQLIASGGIRNGADIAKCMPVGVDAVAIGAAALTALGCNHPKVKAACAKLGNEPGFYDGHHEGKYAAGSAGRDPLDSGSGSWVLAMIIDGKATAEALRERIGRVSTLMRAHGLKPGLAVVLVGEDPASEVYVRNKAKQTEAAGMNSYQYRLPAETSHDCLLGRVESLNNNPDVHGILVQLPLPEHIDEAAIIAAIAPKKDVDGFHAVNAGQLMNGEPGALVPCTPQGCIVLVKQHLGDDLSGKHALVIGRSNIVGKPVAMLTFRRRLKSPGASRLYLVASVR